jgi:hypothetical protein
MGKRRELPIQAAIFADTGAEPKAVYTHLEWLVKEIGDAFPVYIRQKSNIIEDLTPGQNSTGQKFASAPFFTLNDDGSKGITRRQCTSEYKVGVVDRSIRRDVLGLEPRKHIPKDVAIFQYIGMSAEEGKRVVRVRARFASDLFATPVFPLFEKWMTRADCEQWLKDYGVPHETPRSACTFCPYRSDKEWIKMRDEAPEDFAQAVWLDSKIRQPGLVLNRKFKSNRFVHRSCVPLGEVEFRPKHCADPQSTLPGLADECDGMCGT